MLLVLENEVDRDKRYFVPEIVRYLPQHRVHDVAHGDVPDIEGVVGDGGGDSDVDGVILSGSTAGVYESADYPWMDELRTLVRDLVAHEIPTLGVCFGHQLVNDALGGSVEHRGLTAELVDVDLADDPLFAGVGSRIPMVHGDHVTALGDGMESIAEADYYPNLASRHEDAPLWTVQYHPEFTDRLLPNIARDFGWQGAEDFSGVSVERTFANFARLAEKN
ncbi:GMP synthase (glutamine-hydrolysing) [Halogranum gelatinilyticum]|uniref:GMP synthase (Glutamine-hydrolysing) n=1 Tax=Halogranum gelatinilyticum TaxID=660521 RepID=A0A1G9PT50_9EURY|nr:type 1 glutamine amidotransferase [Halogranum gelatinilyticum]SDM01920.1 GMP synthase (glutamine-hydrolysing) [Halogranum gelatinilyticum]